VASELSTRVRAFAISAVLASLKHTTDVAQKALVQGSQALLPPWGAELVNQSSSTIIAGVLGALSSGAWDSEKGKSEGRKKLLENLAKLLGEQVGGGSSRVPTWPRLSRISPWQKCGRSVKQDQEPFRMRLLPR
jgi:hypothetical protein